MPKSLAQGHTKLAILTTSPANPAAPTTTELNAGISSAARVLDSDFTWSAGDSDKVQEKSLADTTNVNALGASNYNAGLTLFRYFNAGTGVPDATEDSLFTAMKTKGTNLWIYARKDGKLESAAWATGDDIYLGGAVITDTPQAQDNTGYVKNRIPLEMQVAYPNITVA